MHPLTCFYTINFSLTDLLPITQAQRTITPPLSYLFNTVMFLPDSILRPASLGHPAQSHSIPLMKRCHEFRYHASSCQTRRDTAE